MWHIKKMSALSSQEFYQIMKLRVNTFVVEQKRIYPEVDDNDPLAFHIYYEEPDSHEVTAYARAFRVKDQVTFGRVVVAKSKRGTGFGDELLDQILNCCQTQWPNQAISIEAQEQVTGYYANRGFQTVGKPFIFNSTPHIEMHYSRA